LITTEGFDYEAFLKGGQALERIWLEFTKLGYVIQPMTAITLFYLRWLLIGKTEFSSSQQKWLSHVWRDFQNLFPEINFNKSGLVMLLRFGRAADVNIGTLRKSIKDLTLLD